jgi:hypothetical protein
MDTTASQAAQIERKDRESAFKQATIDKITHEMAVLKRLKFAAQSEAFNAEQRSLWTKPSPPTWRRCSTSLMPGSRRPRTTAPN